MVGFPELGYGVCAASLLAYLVGWPAGALGPAHGARWRFAGAGIVAGVVMLALVGWPLPTAAFVGLVGGALAAGLGDAAAGRPRTSAVEAPRAAPAPSAPAATSTGAAETERVSFPAAASAAAPIPVDPFPIPEAAAVPDEPLGAELYDERSRTSDRIRAPDVLVHGCLRCATENAADARFCKSCSAPLVPWTCEGCRRVNGVDATFCEGCGQPVPLLVSPFEVQAIPDDAPGDRVDAAAAAEGPSEPLVDDVGGHDLLLGDGAEVIDVTGRHLPTEAPPSMVDDDPTDPMGSDEETDGR